MLTINRVKKKTTVGPYLTILTQANLLVTPVLVWLERVLFSHQMAINIENMQKPAVKIFSHIIKNVIGQILVPSHPTTFQKACGGSEKCVCVGREGRNNPS